MSERTDGVELSTQRDKQFLSRGTRLTVLGMIGGNIAPVLVVLLARTFPPSVFGLYVSVQLLVLTASKLTSLGLDRGLAWYVAANEKAPDVARAAIAAATRWVVLIASAVVAAVGAGAALGGLSVLGDFPEDEALFVLACFAALPAWSVLYVHAGALEGAKRPEFRVLVNQTLVFALAPALALALYFLGLDKWSLPSGLVASNVIGAALVCRATHRVVGAVPYGSRPALDRALLRYSLPLSLNELLAGVLQRADLWMILYFLGPAPAAVYAVMSTLTAGVRAVRQSYDQLLIPVVGSMEPGARHRLPEVFSFAAHRITIIQLAVAVGVLFFPAELMSIAGRDYVIEPQALSILLAAQVVQGLGGLAGTVVLGLGHSRPLLVSSGVALVINVALNAILIPRQGIVGAALATTIAVAMSGVFLVVVQVRATGQWLYQRRLVPNMVLITAFLVCALGFHAAILSMPLVDRALAACCALAVIGLYYWWAERGERDTTRAAPSGEPPAP